MSTGKGRAKICRKILCGTENWRGERIRFRRRCERRESNPDPLRDRILSPARLPVPPRSRSQKITRPGARCPLPTPDRASASGADPRPRRPILARTRMATIAIEPRHHTLAEPRAPNQAPGPGGPAPRPGHGPHGAGSRPGLLHGGSVRPHRPDPDRPGALRHPLDHPLLRADLHLPRRCQRLDRRHSPQTAASCPGFLLTRGLWLILLEMTVISFGWYFSTSWTQGARAQVIWAIGASMVVLAGTDPLTARCGCGIRPRAGGWAQPIDGVAPEVFGAFEPLWRVLHVRGPLESCRCS